MRFFVRGKVQSVAAVGFDFVSFQMKEQKRVEGEAAADQLLLFFFSVPFLVWATVVSADIT